MKRLLLPLLLGALPLMAAAQTQQPSVQKQTAAKTYAPGKWYAGISREWVPYAVHELLGNAWGITAGYNLHPSLALQLGINPANIVRRPVPSGPPATLPPDFAYPEIIIQDSPYWFSPSVYVPLTLRYSLSKPSRRLHPYLLAGVHGFLGSFQVANYRYENLMLVDQEVSPKLGRSGFGASAGVGLRIRFAGRFSLYGEATAIRGHQQNYSLSVLGLSGTRAGSNWQNQTFATGRTGWGIVYDFR
jgi:hypothetical protein